MLLSGVILLVSIVTLDCCPPPAAGFWKPEVIRNLFSKVWVALSRTITLVSLTVVFRSSVAGNPNFLLVAVLRLDKSKFNFLVLPWWVLVDSEMTN